MFWMVTSSTNRWGANTTRPLTRCGNIDAYSKAMDAPSLWPKNQGGSLTPTASSLTQLLREVLPHRQRPQPLVQEHHQRCRPALWRNPLVFHPHWPTSPVNGGPFAAPAGTSAYAPVHARDSSSRSLKRWILPVAVLGSSGTNSMKRGYL